MRTADTQTSNFNRRILVIDDMQAIHDDFRKILLGRSVNDGLDSLDNQIFGRTTPVTGASFEVDSAFQGQEGLQAVVEANESDAPYAVAFVDVRMPPGWDGVQTTRHLLEADKNLLIVICTAYSDYATEDMIQHFGLSDRVMILKKPFDVAEVSLLAVSLTQRWNRADEINGFVSRQSDALQHAQEFVRQVRDKEADLRAEADPLNTDGIVLARQLREATEGLLKTQDVAIYALTTLVESRDCETGDHLKRMQKYSQIVAEHLSKHGPYATQIDDQFLHDFSQSTPLHDIGKIGIPDGILLKPGKLTPPEFETMKQHTVIGAETLAGAAKTSRYGDFLSMAIEVARSHHERFDGAGYPDGLSGDAIPLPARIVAVGDVFDAITSQRVYKLPATPQEAWDYITDESGKHFDPAVVDAFKEVFEQLIHELDLNHRSEMNRVNQCQGR